ETGVSDNKRRLHKVGYFRDLLASNEEVNESIRPLLRVSRDTIVRLQKAEYALVSSLQRDPLLAERIKRLRTVPGVGPITALTWALEMGEVSRFPSIREATSYCGLCGDEKSSADKVMRTPLSKQRNKHIQRVLVEAAKLAPRQDHDLALGDGHQTPEALFELFQDWQRTHTQSSVTVRKDLRQEWMSGSAKAGNHRREAHARAAGSNSFNSARSS